MTEPASVFIIVPAFNESEALANVLDQLTRSPYNVIVIDDGSSDDTSAIALRFPVVVLRHICNLGQGAALQTGITYALARAETKFIITFDSDGQHEANDLERLLRPLRQQTCDVVLGSRFMPGGETVNMEFSKRVLLRAAARFTRLLTGLRVTDSHNGLRALTRAAAERICISQNRMAHASQILAQIAAAGLSYCEAPVKIVYTAYSKQKGQSIFNSLNIVWDMLAEKIR